MSSNESVLIEKTELQILEKIGEGSFGEVWKGKWKTLAVAIKTMKTSMKSSEFVREGLLMIGLQHPNVVQFHGICVTDNQYYLVTEFMDCGQLGYYLQKCRNRLSEDLLFNICKQICKGMSYLAHNNIVHRDLAARNCLINSANIVKVSDFGLARFLPNKDVHYTNNQFNPLWLSPEIMKHRKYSTKSDVWAFGVLMWEVYSYGETPYRKLVGEAFRVPEYVMAGKVLNKPQSCNETVYTVMKKCWSYTPESRPFFNALETYFTENSRSSDNNVIKAYSGVWVNCSNGSIPAGTSKFEKMYIIRSMYQGALIPGKLPYPGHKTAYIPCGAQEIPVKEYQVLCNFDGKWAKCVNKKIPATALEAGRNSREILYIGRVLHNQELCYGKARASDGYCFIPYKGHVYKYSDFEVLIK